MYAEIANAEALPMVSLRIPRLSPDRIESACRTIDPVFLNSPQFQSEPWSDQLGFDLWLKVETINPIRCFKGRGADFFLATNELPAGKLVCASAGNFGQAMAYAARSRGLALTVFASIHANALKIQRMRELGANVKLQGVDFDAAKEHGRTFAEANGQIFVEDGREPAIAEGAGTIAAELDRLPQALDLILVPLGNGALLAGIGCWMKARHPACRVIGVCVHGAPAMARSWQAGAAVTTDSVNTIADGIAVRIPVPEALDDLDSVVDEIVFVDDSDLLSAMQATFLHHGLVIEPAGAAAVAAASVHRQRFKGRRAGAVLCGGNLTPLQIQEWLVTPQTN